jgi:hypothetical protein
MYCRTKSSRERDAHTTAILQLITPNSKLKTPNSFTNLADYRACIAYKQRKTVRRG